MKKSRHYWETRELVIIGSFTAMIKIISFFISITGGGMNPLSMILKNVVQTALLIILLFSVKKFGTLSLYVLISGVMTMITMGSGMMTLPGLLAGGLLSDFIIKIAGGYKSNFAVLTGVALFDFLSRFISLSVGYLMVRENTAMLLFAFIAVGVGYIGCLIGLFTGKSFAKELRHAGVIHD